MSGRLLGGQQVESLLALHSLLGEGIVGGEASGVGADGRVLAGVIELYQMLEKMGMVVR